MSVIADACRSAIEDKWPWLKDPEYLRLRELYRSQSRTDISDPALADCRVFDRIEDVQDQMSAIVARYEAEGCSPASSVVVSVRELTEVVMHYAICALWSSTDDSTPSGGYPLDDNYGLEDLAAETMKSMINDCLSFMVFNAEDIAAYCEGLGYGSEQIGHDYWLTRNGHGAGFWDRYYGPDETLRAVCLRLSESARKDGEIYLMVESDGKIYA